MKFAIQLKSEHFPWPIIFYAATFSFVKFIRFTSIRLFLHGEIWYKKEEKRFIVIFYQKYFLFHFSSLKNRLDVYNLHDDQFLKMEFDLIVSSSSFFLSSNNKACRNVSLNLNEKSRFCCVLVFLMNFVVLFNIYWVFKKNVFLFSNNANL